MFPPIGLLLASQTAASDRRPLFALSQGMLATFFVSGSSQVQLQVTTDRGESCPGVVAQHRGPAPSHSRRPARVATARNLQEHAARQAMLAELAGGSVAASPVAAAEPTPAPPPRGRVRRSVSTPYLLAPNGGPPGRPNALSKPPSPDSADSDRVLVAFKDGRTADHPEESSTESRVPAKRDSARLEEMVAPLPRRRTSLNSSVSESAKPLDDVMEGATGVMG